MSMSLEERRQSAESSLSNITQTTTTKSATPNQQRHQLTVTSLNHHHTNANHRSSPTTIQSCQAAVTNSTLKQQQSQSDIMAMHNFGPNSSQHEQQLKNQQQPTNSGTDSTSWHNNNNSNNINNNNNSDGTSSNTGNNDHVNESQQSSVANNVNDHKVSLTDNSKGQAGSRPTLNRQQQQQQQQQQQLQQQQQQQHQQPQLQSQSQQYHGIFSPQIPAILHSTLASRVDQIIRTTLHDSPAYTPPTSRNNNAGNNTNVITSTPSSNMPQPSSSSSLIFNTTTGSVNTTTSAPQNILSHPTSSGIGLMSNATTTAPITSLYGSTLSTMGDNLMSASNSNLAKTSPSHSALTAAAALQSLNQSHVQRSQQQQLAHTQPSPYSGLPGSGSATKPPSNGNGTPMPQAAHGGSIHQMSRLNATSMANSDQHSHLSFPSEQSNIGSLNFSSRMQPNNNLGSKMVGQQPAIGLSNMNWQDQLHTNGMMPRLPPLHGLNAPLPTYSTSSPRHPYGIMNPQLPNSLGPNNGNNMIGSDSDSLSKLNSMKGSPGQTNPMQFRDEKNFPMNFPPLLSNKQNQPNLDNLRGPPPNSTNEAIQSNIANERLIYFAYNLLSQGVPNKPPKKIVLLDDDMKMAIQNGEFYSKYGHIASGIVNNQIIVPNFSIIDYLRKDVFVREEVDNIERINGTLSRPDLICLMELVRQRPWSDRNGPELGKPPQYNDINPMNIGSSGSNSQPDHLSMTNLHHNSPLKGNSFLSSSPNRSDLLGPQGIDRSRRSSQSPSDNSRSQLGNNTSNSKFINVHNPHHVHQQQASIINSHQFTSPLCPPNQQQQQQQHSAPQNNRSSPFQSPMSIGSAYPLARPPRSHSTVVGLNTGSLNPPYALTPPQVRQPPAAHQSSSRPNLAGLDMHLLPAHANPTSIPVTAHMSSKTPQTPKLQDTLPRPNSKSVPQLPPQFGNNKLGPKDIISANHMDYQSQPGRFDLDQNNVMSLQTHVGGRNQELNNRELLMKRSTTPHYLPSSMLGPGANRIDLGRQQEFMDGGLSSQSQLNQSSMSNYSGDLFNRNLNNSSVSNMPPPSMDHRQLTNDLSARNINFGPGIPTGSPNDSQAGYNALMAAYQQQFMGPGKVGENPSGPVNMMGQVPAYMIMNQSGSQRPSVGEPMHVDILQQVKQPQGQIGSPKLNNQRSIITGSGSAPTRKSKKAKPSPPANAQSLESKATTSEMINQSAQSSTVSNPSMNMSNDLIPHHNKENPSISFNSAINSSMNPAISNDNPQTSATNQDVVGTAAAAGKTAACTSAATGGAASSTSGSCDGNPNETISARGIINSADLIIRKDTDLTPDCSKTIEATKSLQSEVTTKPNENTDSNQCTKAEASTESKQSIDTNCLQNPPIVDQPSKYQKLFTKKAWLKNYDLEDQARINGETLTTDDKMPVATRSSAKIEEKPEQIDQAAIEANQKDCKPLTSSVKTNGGAKNGKTKVDGKKRAKEDKAKKANSVNSFKAGKVSAIKTTDHDSEETNASTSDLDTDETDSLRSTSDKKLRRMPRRKVKLSSDRESSDQPNVPSKTKTTKESSDKETAVVRGRGKKEKTSNTNSDAVSGSAKRKYNSDDESVKQKTKKIKENVVKHLEKSSSSPVSKAKKRTGEKFLQTEPCYEIVPKSIRCLECRRVRQASARQANVKGDKVQPKQPSKTNWDDFCRFFEFRKLRYNKAEQIVVAGFSEAGDAKESDMQLWLPLETGEVPENISYEVAKFILANIGDEFCKLVSQERLALDSYEAKSGDKKITWKRAVNGLRELCDVCSTTLFNCHYVCDRCGFVVCIDCHDSRAQNQDDSDADGAIIKKETSDANVNCENNNTDAEQTAVSNKKSKKDSHGWIFCAKNEEHSHDKLTLTKIIAGNCLEEVWSLLHEIRENLRLGECFCKNSNKPSDVKLEKVEDVQLNGCVIKQEVTEESEGSHSTLKGLLLASNDSPLTGSVDAKQQNTMTIDAPAKGEECKTGTFDEAIDNRELDFGSEDDSRQVSAAIEGCIASLAVDGGDDIQDSLSKSRVQDINFNHLSGTSSRLCNGDLLVLTHARHKDNIRLFREHWRHGKPVLVRGLHHKMNIDMWLPGFFLYKFGDYRSDLVDCRNGDIHRQSMRKYWDGFEPTSSKKRTKDDTTPGHIVPATNEEPSAVSTSYYSGSALWRLKDWPPGQDFNEILPEHYDDFMNNLPLKDYTTRTGKLNLACRLPKEMLKPDLGPKMYSAYGTNKFPERGTTNLHLDISDAVNVMVYVGGALQCKQGGYSEYSEIYDNTINDCYIDPAMKDQIRQNKLIPGALWHIFRPSDVAKIREFLNKVSDECKLSKEKRIDPIHDQIWYLDQNLLDRLQQEYGVKSYPILQCMGDAILIPAGAPHQVKNLQNCIKVANDFVSPENIRYCLQLTNEFRNLPETHINQEDKLQIKNIMYHSVKESIQYIKMIDSGKVSLSDESSDEESSDDFAPNQTKASK